MRISRKITGLDALRRRLDVLPAAARAAAEPALQAAAAGVADDIRARLRDAGQDGPSRPGTPPADHAGRLAASVAVTRAEHGTAVTVSAPFARPLEYGTAHMAARPFLRPAGLRAGAAAKTLLAAALRRGLAP